MASSSRRRRRRNSRSKSPAPASYSYGQNSYRAGPEPGTVKRTRFRTVASATTKSNRRDTKRPDLGPLSRRLMQNLQASQPARPTRSRPPTPKQRAQAKRLTRFLQNQLKPELPLVCKDRPPSNRSRGGGSRAFIPWCIRRS